MHSSCRALEQLLTDVPRLHSLSSPLLFVPLPQVNHPNCVQLFEMFETSKKMHLVLELLTGGQTAHG